MRALETFTVPKQSICSASTLLCAVAVVPEAAASALVASGKQLPIAGLQGSCPAAMTRPRVCIQGGLPRDGSLERMAEVVIFNRGRLAPLWEVFFDRVRAMTASPAAADRSAAAACLKRVVLTLLASRKGPADSTENGGNTDSVATGAAGPVGGAGSISLAVGVAAEQAAPGEGGVKSTGAPMGEDAELEVLLLDAVEQLCRHPTAYVDVRYVCVESVHEVLQVRPSAMPRSCW